jgi:hypothetical protein
VAARGKGAAARQGGKNWFSRLSIAHPDAIADGRRLTGMSADEEIVYDFTTELQRNKRVSDVTLNRADHRFGKTRCGRYDRYQRLLHVSGNAIEHGALRVCRRGSPPITFPELRDSIWCGQQPLSQTGHFRNLHQGLAQSVSGWFALIWKR